MTDAGKLAAYERVADFVTALIRHRYEAGDKTGQPKRWTQAEIVTRAGINGRPYIGQRSLTELVRGTMDLNRVVQPETWQHVNLALHLRPGTIEAVYATPDHGLDPLTVPEWDPPSVLSAAAIQAMEQEMSAEIAGRIAQRAATSRS